MAKRLRALNKKRERDVESLNKKQALPARHKVAEERSKKALAKKYNRSK